MRVQSMTPGGAAEKGGIITCDRITDIDGKALGGLGISNDTELLSFLTASGSCTLNFN